MSTPWVFAETLPESGAITLSADESRHVAARRLRPGEALVLFDGRGRTATGRLEASERKAARVVIDEVERHGRPAAEFVVASAIPKGERLSTMLQMLGQLGLAIWQPLVLEDSAVRRLDPDTPRLRRVGLEACKVARRAWPLEIRPPCRLEELLSRTADGVPVFFGDREGPPSGLAGSAGLVVIGPEAGLSPAERRALREAGAEARSFGPHNLRIETAAVAAVVAHHVGRGGTGSVDGEV